MKRLLILLSLSAITATSADTNVFYRLNLGSNYVIEDSHYLTNDVITWTNIIDRAATNGSITNLVNILCARGEVCKVKGHCWRDGRPGEGNGAYFADWHPNTNFRTCTLCGACQTQDITWK